MDVVLDNIGFSLQKIGGLSFVWKAIIESLQKSDLTYTCLEYSGALNNEVRRKMQQFNIEKRNSRIPKLERYLNPYIDIDTPFIFHSSHYRTTPNPNSINITTVHDFTSEKYNKGLPKIIHSWQKFNAIRNADVIVSISENTKRDILYYLPDINPQKIKVIYNGVSLDYKPIDSNLKCDNEKYILFVGSRISYKNFSFVVDSLTDTNYSLAIVGGPLNTNEIKLLNNKLGKSRYHYFGYLDNSKLNELYNSCFCLAYPSSYEGFGIPILEAQRAGCPVIAYNSSSIPEVIGDSSLLLEKIDIDEFHNKLATLKNYHYRQEIIANGIEKSKMFSWKKMGDSYIDLYKELLHI